MGATQVWNTIRGQKPLLWSFHQPKEHKSGQCFLASVTISQANKTYTGDIKPSKKAAQRDAAIKALQMVGEEVPRASGSNTDNCYRGTDRSGTDRSGDRGSKHAEGGERGRNDGVQSSQRSSQPSQAGEFGISSSRGGRHGRGGMDRPYTQVHMPIGGNAHHGMPASPYGGRAMWVPTVQPPGPWAMVPYPPMCYSRHGMFPHHVMSDATSPWSEYIPYQDNVYPFVSHDQQVLSYDTGDVGQGPFGGVAREF